MLNPPEYIVGNLAYLKISSKNFWINFKYLAYFAAIIYNSLKFFTKNSLIKC